MIDNLFNLLFRCRHGRLTRPITPINALGHPEGEPYVVCLDCGRHFTYDAREMRMGKAIRSATVTEYPHAPPPAQRKWLKAIPWLTVPVGVVAGALVKAKRRG
jgi:hypothetical protein